jgi:hypothetical protein
MSPVAALALAVVLTARLVTTDVTGVVRDGATGEPVGGAVVSLDDLGHAAVTAEDGTYWLADVPPGPQHLSVRLLGFQFRSLHILVPAEGTLRVDLVLRMEPIEVEAVVVRSRIPIRGIDEGGPDLDPTRRLSGAAIRNDPFAAEPDVLQALVGGSVSDTPESGGGLHVRGGDGDEVGYLLDGIPVFSPYHSGVRSGAWNPDAVARIELRTDPTLAADGLSGAVLATTIEPGERLGVRGELSTWQVGLTFDGPLFGKSGFVLAGRSGYPGLISPPDEPDYLVGEDYDLLAKLAVPAVGGDLRLLAFDNKNVVRASSRITGIGEEPADPGEQNRYAWHGRSFGLTWDAPGREGARPSVRAWRAGLDASFLWHGVESGPTRVGSDRVQYGLQASVGWDEPWGTAEVGARTTHDRVSYELSTRADEPSGLEIEGEGSDFAVFARLARRLGERVELGSGLSAAGGANGGRLLPHVSVQVRLGESAGLYAEYTRSNQALQSLRNPESVVARIFPAELYAGGEASGLSTAQADLGALGLVAVPWPGVRFDVEAYARSLDGLALLDPEEGRPFAGDEGREGSGSVVGGAVGASVSAARYAAIGSFGVERVELRVGDTEWMPAYAAGRTARVGVIAFPTASLSIRVGWTGQYGRRGTDTVGFLEWEACNLLDRGCEFAGSPEELGELGGRELPPYHRLDLSVRKHWHFPLGKRDAQIEAYMAASNLLGRSNVLGFVVDPSTGDGVPIDMRPRAPLTLGLGWRF